MTMTTRTPAAGAADQPRPTRNATFIRFFLRFAEAGGVTVPGFPDRAKDGDEQVPWGRERAHLQLDTDPWGRPLLPGTSLAGALREWVRHAEGEQTADDWFGHLLAAGEGGAEEVDARASLIWVLGSRPVGPDGLDLDTVPSQIRASTAISRSRAGAEADTLRVEEVLPPGSRFEVFLRWDNAPPPDLDRLLALLAVWPPLLGRGTSRGRGRCTVESIRHGTLRLDDPGGLHQWLTSSGPTLARAVATQDGPPATGRAGREPLIHVPMRITGPLRVGSGEPPQEHGEDGGQIIPLFREDGRYLLPGTGLKGLLRSRAEYILRSAGTTPTPCLDQRCGRCWTCHVFGHGGGQDVKARAVGARAVLRVTDAVIGNPTLVRRQHVAIDRFTGGAAPGLLYTVEALEGGTFTLTIEPLARQISDGTLRELRAIIRLILQDLNDGITGVGAGVARGYGTVTADLTDAETRGTLPSLPEAQAELAQMTATSAGREAL